MDSTLARKTSAEFVGTALLLGAALGGGQAAAAAGAPPHMALLLGTLAAAATLFTVLHAIGPVSGGHVNPAVTVSMLAVGRISAQEAAAYVVAQISGGLIGAMAANAIWDTALVAGPGVGSLASNDYWAEVIATCGLVGAIHAAVHGGNESRLPMIVPAAVIAGSFTAPFGMANPAVAIAAGLVGGGLSTSTIAVQVCLELGFASLVGVGVALLYGKPARHVETQQVFDIRLDSAQPIDEDVVTGAITAAIRTEDRLVRTADGGWRIVVDDVDDATIGAIKDRVEAFVTLATSTEQPDAQATVAASLVPVVAGR
ncbi:MAG: aquaporin [Actinomycetota bacterium]